MENQKYNNLKLGERGAIISIIAYICLSIIKLIIAYISDSAALKADGLNNTTDIIASIALLIGLGFHKGHLIKIMVTVIGKMNPLHQWLLPLLCLQLVFKSRLRLYPPCFEVEMKHLTLLLLM